MTGKILE